MRHFSTLAYGIGVALLMTVPVIIGSVYQWNLTESLFSRFALTVWGFSNILHYVIQLVAASLNRRRMNRYHYIPEEPQPSVSDLSNVEQKYAEPVTNRYALAIVGHREDPHYFRMALKAAKTIFELEPLSMTLFVIIDGNEEDDDQEMMDIAQEVFQGLGIYRSLPDPLYEKLETEREVLVQDLLEHPILCLSQPKRGKRYAMYSAMWLASYLEIPYLMFTDSDTWIHPEAPHYLRMLLAENDQVGATTGHVRIYNICNLLTFLVDLKYWFAFNLERAAQSYFGCVSCVSGPLGMYRVSVLQTVMEEWIQQRFLGSPATFGDDRHLTNLVLKKGFQVLYTHKAMCFTETPHVLIRWFTQQTRWGRSFVREYLLGLTSFYRVSWWLAYDLTYLAVYSLFLFVFAILMFLDLSYSSLLVLIATSIIVTFVRALFAMLIEKDTRYVFFAFFGIIYFVSLLPLKMWSAISVGVNSWGTSNRKSIHNRVLDVWPVMTWIGFLLFCIVRAKTGTFDIVSWVCLGIIGSASFVSVITWLYLVYNRHLYTTQKQVEEWLVSEKGRNKANNL